MIYLCVLEVFHHALLKITMITMAKVKLTT